jgi:hypothetical protein
MRGLKDGNDAGEDTTTWDVFGEMEGPSTGCREEVSGNREGRLLPPGFRERRRQVYRLEAGQREAFQSG